MFLIGQCNTTVKGQLTRHACLSEQNASWTVVSHFAELTVACNLNRCLVSFLNFVTTRPNWTPLGPI